MVDVEWGTLVVTVGSGLLLFWMSTGVLTFIRHRHSRKAKVSGNESKARAEYIGDLESQIAARTAERNHALEQLELERARRTRAEERERQLDDYIHDLRDWAARNGCINPPDWPPYRG